MDSFEGGLQVHAQASGSPSGSRIIVLDEPELHLHSDAQRHLRKVIEKVSRRDNTQVVYTTHSPCFISPANPSSIRLVRRTSNEGIATSVIDNTTDLPATRRELGVMISESLALAAVTVIVEGDTEYQTIRRLCMLIASKGDISSDTLQDVFDQVTPMDGHGDNITNHLSIVSKFGVMPVVILDGDKQDTKREIERDFPKAIVSILPDGKEYEDILPLGLYLRQSILCSQLRTQESAKPNAEDYEQWLDEIEGNANKPISKLVGHFLFDHGCIAARKQDVFRACLSAMEEDDAEIQDLDWGLLMPLFRKIESAVNMQN